MKAAFFFFTVAAASAMGWPEALHRSTNQGYRLLFSGVEVSQAEIRELADKTYPQLVALARKKGVNLLVLKQATGHESQVDRTDLNTAPPATLEYYEALFEDVYLPHARGGALYLAPFFDLPNPDGLFPTSDRPDRENPTILVTRDGSKLGLINAILQQVLSRARKLQPEEMYGVRVHRIPAKMVQFEELNRTALKLSDQIETSTGKKKTEQQLKLALINLSTLEINTEMTEDLCNAIDLTSLLLQSELGFSDTEKQILNKVMAATLESATEDFKEYLHSRELEDITAVETLQPKAVADQRKRLTARWEASISKLETASQWLERYQSTFSSEK